MRTLITAAATAVILLAGSLVWKAEAGVGSLPLASKGYSPVEQAACWCGPYRCACRRYWGPRYRYWGGPYYGYWGPRYYGYYGPRAYGYWGPGVSVYVGPRWWGW